jgi:glutathione S-transferase
VLRLITIPISHYCEKARWALERAEIPYREERHVQGIHRVAARRAGGGQTVPVLVTPDGVLAESEDILRWVDGRTPPELRLFPDDPAERAEVERLSRRFDERLGPRGRRFMYIKVLPHRNMTLEVNNQGVPHSRVRGPSSASLRRPSGSGCPPTASTPQSTPTGSRTVRRRRAALRDAS